MNPLDSACELSWLCPQKPKPMTLAEAAQAIIAKYGGVRATERATGVDKGFISRLAHGHKAAPSEATLAALGLRGVTLYEVVR